MALTEESLFASIGRKQTQIELDAGEYNNLLLVLSKVVSGEIPKEDVIVDLQSRSWKVEPASQVEKRQPAKVESMESCHAPNSY